MYLRSLILNRLALTYAAVASFAARSAVPRDHYFDLVATMYSCSRVHAVTAVVR